MKMKNKKGEGKLEIKPRINTETWNIRRIKRKEEELM